MGDFGSGFGWGILSGLGQAYGDYAQRSELEKRQEGLRSLDSGAQDRRLPGPERRPRHDEARGHNEGPPQPVQELQGLYEEEGWDESAWGLGRPSFRRTCAVSGKRSQQKSQWEEGQQQRHSGHWAEVERTRAVCPRYRLGASGPPDIPGIDRPFRSDRTRAESVGAQREFQELPQRPPSLDRPPMQQSLDPQRGPHTHA